MKNLLIILIGLTIFGCKPKFDPNAEYKAIDIVYGILDPGEQKQYISVTKAFQNNESNALDIAQINDSIYHQDSITVSIINPENDYKIQLTKEIIDGREDGVFNNSGNIFYTFDVSRFTINSGKEYQIEVKSNTGKVSYSKITTLNEFQIINPGKWTIAQLNFYQQDDFNNPVVTVYNSIDEKIVYNVTLNLIYDTYDEDKIILRTDTLPYLVQTKGFYENTDGAYELDFNISGENILNYINNNIPPARPNNSRQFSINTFLVVEAFGAEMFEYITAEDNFSTLSQTKPFYTNIFNQNDNEEQAGLFTSVRKETKGTITIPNSTITYIQQTYPALGF